MPTGPCFPRFQFLSDESNHFQATPSLQDCPDRKMRQDRYYALRQNQKAVQYNKIPVHQILTIPSQRAPPDDHKSNQTATSVSEAKNNKFWINFEGVKSQQTQDAMCPSRTSHRVMIMHIRCVRENARAPRVEILRVRPSLCHAITPISTLCPPTPNKSEPTVQRSC